MTVQLKKVGVVLSGGGFRGLMHLGAIQALEEAKLKPQLISATSFGGFMGAFYAAGHEPSKILEAFDTLPIWPFLLVAPSNKGVLSIRPLRKFLNHYLPASFEELKLPLTVNATDLETGQTVFFSSGDLISPLLASATVPILFKPIQLHNRLLVDGGMLNNLPVEPLLDQNCDLIIGCNSNFAGVKKVGNYRHVVERTFNLAINQNVEGRKKHLDLLIEPPEMANYLTFDWKLGKEMFAIGYEHTKALLKSQEGKW